MKENNTQTITKQKQKYKKQIQGNIKNKESKEN